LSGDVILEARDVGEPLVVPLCPAIFDRDVVALDIAGFVEAS
jgi:hypothetical protein